MVEIIEILRQEHRNIEKLLQVMERELTVFDRGERPDYEVFVAIVEFFKNYPDSCHHPKEDMIYEKFRTRDPGRAASVADLEAEHREGAVRLRRVARAIESVLNDQELLRESVDRIVRDFIDSERKHIALEEEVVFPAIVDTLQPGDWADIALTLADRYGPPSEADFEEQFSTLRRDILELEEAAVARRS
ncbi:MAG TPA: hemerythrin domain-containing protein [Pseudolabrys sp.]|jgi:hemerythrin-like domain-containing protein